MCRNTARLAAAVSFIAGGAFAAPGPCENGKASQYAGYTVTAARIQNPLGILEGWAPEFRSLGGGLKVKAGRPFSVAEFNADVTYLGQKLDAEFGASSSFQRVKLDYATGYLEDCDNEARTLRVVYPIFTSVVPSLNPPSIEEASDEAQRPATTGAEQVSGRSVSVTPLGGYNQTRGVFGGLDLLANLGRVNIWGRSEDSGNSQSSNLNLEGELAATKFWNHASWDLGFVYTDMPAGGARFKEGKLVGRFSASTQEFTGAHLMFRYGAALEGGHQQSSYPSAAAQLTPDSAYGSLKFYAGITGRPRPSAFSASYGLQLGDTFRADVPVFKKHLMDVGYNRSFFARKPLGDRDDFKGPLSTTVHRAVGLETRFTAGLIQDAQEVPLAERFFGGNQIHSFVAEDSWVIPDDAFIRSIPENRLGAIEAGALGGSRFYSANVTMSFTAWGRPFIPKELAMMSAGTNAQSCSGQVSGGRPTFPCTLNGPFQSSATALASYYKTHDKDYVRLTSEVPARVRDLEAKLSALSAQLDAIPPAAGSDNALAQQLSDVNSDVVATSGDLSVLEDDVEPEVTTLLMSSIASLKDHSGALTRSLRAASQAAAADTLDQMVSGLAQGAGDLQATVDQVNRNFPEAKFEDEAWKKLAPGHRAMDVFLNQLNICSIAPVAMFDAAKVWPVGQGVRYGFGPGLRLSLVNVNFTFGYAFNPDRQPSEKAGAIFFSLDVTGLF